MACLSVWVRGSLPALTPCGLLGGPPLSGCEPFSRFWRPPLSKKDLSLPWCSTPCAEKECLRSRCPCQVLLRDSSCLRAPGISKSVAASGACWLLSGLSPSGWREDSRVQENTLRSNKQCACRKRTVWGPFPLPGKGPAGTVPVLSRSFLGVCAAMLWETLHLPELASGAGIGGRRRALGVRVSQMTRLWRAQMTRCWRAQMTRCRRTQVTRFPNGAPKLVFFTRIRKQDDGVTRVARELALIQRPRTCNGLACAGLLVICNCWPTL